MIQRSLQPHFSVRCERALRGFELERLQALVRTTDGFEVAELDMINRGISDISVNSTRQSGTDMTFLFGKPVSIPITTK